MNIARIKYGFWMGWVWAVCMGTSGAQTTNSSPAAVDNPASATSAPSAGKANKKPELTAEQKAFEQSVKALRAGSDLANQNYVKVERKREKAEEQAEAAKKTPSMSSEGVSAKAAGNQGASADSSSDGKGK